MRRREFITFVGCVAAAWPLAARAAADCDDAPPRPALCHKRTGGQSAGFAGGVTAGLKEYGWVEGQNTTIENRFADGKADALPKLAVEVIQLRVDAIVTDST